MERKFDAVQTLVSCSCLPGVDSGFPLTQPIPGLDIDPTSSGIVTPPAWQASPAVVGLQVADERHSKMGHHSTLVLSALLPGLGVGASTLAAVAPNRASQ